jgi:hypothetical protein
MQLTEVIKCLRASLSQGAHANARRANDGDAAARGARLEHRPG